MADISLQLFIKLNRRFGAMEAKYNTRSLPAGSCVLFLPELLGSDLSWGSCSGFMARKVACLHHGRSHSLGILRKAKAVPSNLRHLLCLCLESVWAFSQSKELSISDVKVPSTFETKSGAQLSFSICNPYPPPTAKILRATFSSGNLLICFINVSS